MSNTTDQPTESNLKERYERLIEISRQLTSTYNHTSLLQQIISASMELTDTQAASILLLDPLSGELRFEISSNIDPREMEDIIVPMDGSIAGWVVTHGEPRVIEDVTSDPKHFGEVDKSIQFHSENMVAVPMRTHDKVIGVLEALNKRNRARFSEADITTLSTLANQAAIAIENARLFRQSDFIAEMVHELRTPLLSLKASTSLLLRPDLPEDRREDMILTMQAETNRLMRLTTEFLDLAQMESGRARIEIEPFDLQKLLRESADVLSAQASEKGVEITFADEPFVVNGDRGKIKQVLLNLISNAIKYNRPDGTIELSAVEHLDAEEPMVRIAVADTGYGLSKENQKQMFQKFFRAAKTANQTTGTGLGLVITKHIIEAHNGSIWLESEEGVGTTFYFTVPLLVED